MGKRIELIVGLGNPGPQHFTDRHNAGFWFLDRLAEQHGLNFRAESRFKGETARLQSAGHDCWLLKPATFMNRSGESVQALCAYYRIAIEQVLVVHDELDIEPGDIRLKQGGGHGGHNGLRDIIEKSGSREFSRLRVGIGHPGSASQVTSYVLGRPDEAQTAAIMQACDRALDVMPLALDGELERAMHRLHTRS